MYFKWVVHAVILQLTKFSAGKPRCVFSIISLITQLINNDSFERALRQKITGSTFYIFYARLHALPVTSTTKNNNTLCLPFIDPRAWRGTVAWHQNINRFKITFPIRQWTVTPAYLSYDSFAEVTRESQTYLKCRRTRAWFCRILLTFRVQFLMSCVKLNLPVYELNIVSQCFVMTILCCLRFVLFLSTPGKHKHGERVGRKEERKIWNSIRITQLFTAYFKIVLHALCRMTYLAAINL